MKLNEIGSGARRERGKKFHLGLARIDSDWLGLARITSDFEVGDPR